MGVSLLKVSMGLYNMACIPIIFALYLVYYLLRKLISISEKMLSYRNWFCLCYFTFIGLVCLSSLPLLVFAFSTLVIGLIFFFPVVLKSFTAFYGYRAVKLRNYNRFFWFFVFMIINTVLSIGYIIYFLSSDLFRTYTKFYIVYMVYLVMEIIVMIFGCMEFFSVVQSGGRRGYVDDMELEDDEEPLVNNRVESRSMTNDICNLLPYNFEFYHIDKQDILFILKEYDLEELSVLEMLAIGHRFFDYGILQSERVSDL